jgi:hypothetical protein
MFETYVASVLSGYCICFSMACQVFSCVVASVLDACFKCFIYLQTYVVNVSCGYFQNRSGVVVGTRRSRRLGEGSRRDASSLHVRLRGAGDIQQNGWRGRPDTGIHPDIGR